MFMPLHGRGSLFALAGAMIVLVCGPVWAETPSEKSGDRPLTMRTVAFQDEEQVDEYESTTITETTTSGYRYLGISDFFNVREANSNVQQGQWEFEFSGEWSTGGGGDDDFKLTESLRYGVTDDIFVELRVLPINLGDGGDQGAGDLAVILFTQILHETDATPAFATWAQLRIPTGDGSSGVDANVHFNLTKTLLPQFRGHVEGFVQTANGGRGGDDENRRHFQWGVGTGVDYSFSDATIATLNYLHRSSENYGDGNQHILEIGLVQAIADNQHFKFAVDIGLDGREETDNFAAKFLWSIDF